VKASFEEIQQNIQKLYQGGDYTQAYELATQNAAHFPDQAQLINYWRICMAVRLGRSAESLSLLSQSLMNGLWYGETLLRKSPSLQPLQGEPEFERLVELNQKLQAHDQAAMFPLLLLRPEGACQDDENPCPLLIALHANGSTAQASMDFWKHAASQGWLVAAPQSSQAMWKDAYLWDDLDVTQSEIERHLGSITQRYAVDAAHIVVAGHSMGGEVAIWLALSGVVEACGFIALGPGGPTMDEPDTWRQLVDRAGGRPLRGCLVYGDADHAISINGIKALASMLNHAGIACRLDRLPGVGHEFHPSYTAALLSGLEFVLAESH
jgi:predicted esterase